MTDTPEHPEKAPEQPALPDFPEPTPTPESRAQACTSALEQVLADYRCELRTHPPMIEPVGYSGAFIVQAPRWVVAALADE